MYCEVRSYPRMCIKVLGGLRQLWLKTKHVKTQKCLAFLLRNMLTIGPYIIKATADLVFQVIQCCVKMQFLLSGPHCGLKCPRCLRPSTSLGSH